nr:uncharacterized protein LOC108943435 [Nicotiana tomentosiformis]
MRDHIIGEDYELWDIVTDGPLATMKKNAEGADVPKTRADCTAEDLRKWEKNTKAKKWLVCGLGPDEYNRIQRTAQVKRSRVTLQYSQYENFSMKEGKTIQEMYTRFTTLTNVLKSLGRTLLEEDKVEKILTRVLPVSWESKITAIQESKNIETLKLDELIGNLNAITEGADLEEDEMAMITKDFKKYLMRGKSSSRGGNYNKTEVSLEERTCDGTCSSIPGNMTGGIEQNNSQTLVEPVPEPVSQQQNIEGTSRGNQLVVKPYRYQSSHPIENIITDPTSGIKTRSSLKILCTFDAFLSFIEPKNIVEAL